MMSSPDESPLLRPSPLSPGAQAAFDILSGRTPGVSQAALRLLLLRLFDHPDELGAMRALGHGAEEAHEASRFLWERCRLLPKSEFGPAVAESGQASLWDAIGAKAASEGRSLLLDDRLVGTLDWLGKWPFSERFDRAALWRALNLAKFGVANLVKWGFHADATGLVYQARRSVETAQDWCECARVLRMIEKCHVARDCLEEAEVAAKWEVGTHLLAAQEWMALDNPQRAREQMKRAETKNGDSMEISCVTTWFDMGFPEEALRCMKIVESQELQSFTWFDAASRANAWSTLGSSVDARRWMTRSTQLLTDGPYPYDWPEWAIAWQALGDKDEAIRCLETAIGFNYPHICAMVAECWFRLGEEAKGRDTLLLAQSLATAKVGCEYLPPWRRIAETWSAVGELQLAREALAHGEETPGDWFSCLDYAKAWEDMGRHDQAVAWLERHESNMAGLGPSAWCFGRTLHLEWVDHARKWRKYGHPERSSACLDRAELALAHIVQNGDPSCDARRSPSDGWVAISKAWEEAGDIRRAQACLEKAGAVAPFAEDQGSGHG